MQGARAAQIIIQEPEKARETTKYFDAAIDCDIYFSEIEHNYNEKKYPIVVNNLFKEAEGLIDIFFNTVMRARAYAKHNYYLSGGVYRSPKRAEAFLGCSDEVKELYKGL
jgi:hypothetical protein